RAQHVDDDDGAIADHRVAGLARHHEELELEAIAPHRAHDVSTAAGSDALCFSAAAVIPAIVSTNEVSRSPAWNRGSSITRRWKGIVVSTPSMRYSSSARR